MNLIKIVTICLCLFATLSSGCKKTTSIGLTNEQAVYESLFLLIKGNTYSKYYIANATENWWFLHNPIKSIHWNSSLKKLGNIPIELVEKLYIENTKSYPLNWEPLITNAVKLPESYAELTKNKEDIKKYCIINDIKGRRTYRQYYTVSRVAISQNKKYAIVKISYHCAPLGGEGSSFVTFEFRENRWQTIGGWLLSIS